MKNTASLLSCVIISLALIVVRVCYSGIGEPEKKFTVTQWDALGYYLYAPAVFIYHDCKKLDWAKEVDAKYNVTGGGSMPVIQFDNGNKVDKYLCGVSILQLPLFALAHVYCKVSGYPPDGFSPPYEYALAYGVLLYCILAIFLLRRILLRYFRDASVSIALLLLCLATNLVQYAAVDSGLSHAYIFPLYVLILYATIKWHDGPSAFWACAIGYIVGLATISRPTEAIMFIIPLLWNTHDKESARAKWALVRANRGHVLYAIAGGIVGILPQLLYWKAVTGSFVFDVGSKWVFLNPWFRVLVGWEKGWFIYTPATLLFVAGLFFIRRYPFRYSVLVFCLLNIWIIISWDEWQYGASYSTRALMQSYPVFALALGAIVERICAVRWRYLLYVLSAYLIGVNLFQVYQYNSNVLHYNDMNRRYYARIYLNPHPSPIVMSLLDTEEWLSNESDCRASVLVHSVDARELKFGANGSAQIANAAIPASTMGGDRWLKIAVRMQVPFTQWRSTMTARLKTKDSVKETRIRLDNPVGNRTGEFATYMRVPAYFDGAAFTLELGSEFDFAAALKEVDVVFLERKK